MICSKSIVPKRICSSEKRGNIYYPTEELLVYDVGTEVLNALAEYPREDLKVLLLWVLHFHEGDVEPLVYRSDCSSSLLASWIKPNAILENMTEHDIGYAFPLRVIRCIMIYTR